MTIRSELAIGRRARIGAWTVAALLLWQTEQAWAQANSTAPRLCKGGGNTYTLTLPAAITVPRDAPVGTMLLAPVVGAEFPALYQCSNSTRNNSAGVARRSLNLTRSGVTVNYSLGGTNINNSPVYNTGLPGVGMVIAFRNLDTGCAPDFWHDVDTDGSKRGPVEGWPSSGCNGDAAGQMANAGGQWAIGLVKTSLTVQPGVVAGKTVMELALAQRDISNSGLDYIAKYPEAQHGFVGMSSIQVNVLSCSTPDIRVPMGDHPKSAFKGVGSTTNPVRLRVAINNCPAALRTVTIRFAEPNKRYVDAAQGVIQLSSDSTARGIGLKLSRASDGNPMRFDGDGYVLSSYDPARGGGLEIVFDAAYYQAQTTVTPGTANAVIEFTMSYQ
ncbi:hypothetical protein E5C33_13575 [Stenotrophomonas maltophilia]|uniref:fimbrial protein n=1 Tax=Stenotrophomonas maltophilia TaxID=40324 RepID=UPI001075FC1D|nr:fimbrial protein [Stenotrophomonas maltophilia]TFZ44668.1 hypothetical protein E5C33_13575 [Stenotrophomonas maltophilia]